MSHPRGDAGDILDGESASSKVCERGVSHTFLAIEWQKRLFKLSATLNSG